MEILQRLFASSPVPGPLIAENSLAARQAQITPPNRTGRSKSMYSQIPNAIEFKKSAAYLQRRRYIVHSTVSLHAIGSLYSNTAGRNY